MLLLSSGFGRSWIVLSVDGKTSNTSAFFARLQFATYALWRAQIKHQVTAKKIFFLENVTKIAAKVVALHKSPQDFQRQNQNLDNQIDKQPF